MFFRLKSMKINVFRSYEFYPFPHLFLDDAKVLQFVICKYGNCGSGFQSTAGSSDSVDIIQR